MKITISKTIKQEVELPKYWVSDSGAYFHKLMGEDSVLEVAYNHLKLTSIQGGACSGVNEISEETFNLKLNEIKSLLNL
jgi:hypothetical protein